MLIPVFYNNAVNGIKNIQPELKDDYLNNKARI